MLRCISVELLFCLLFVFLFFLRVKEMQEMLALFCSIHRLFLLIFLAEAATKLLLVSVYLSDASSSQVHCTGVRDLGAAMLTWGVKFILSKLLSCWGCSLLCESTQYRNPLCSLTFSSCIPSSALQSLLEAVNLYRDFRVVWGWAVWVGFFCCCCFGFVLMKKEGNEKPSAHWHTGY